MSHNRLALESFTADAGGFANASLITGGIEAAGHGIYIDDKTIDGAMRLCLGRSLRSYLKHDGAGGDRLGQEIGFFSGIYREGMKLKARTFEFLQSFKNEAGDLAAKLVEMAQKIPDQFGVSLVLEYKPVWVMADGAELPARLGESAPGGAVRPVPSVRVMNVISADLVQRPAANPNGLLSAATTVDAQPELQPAQPITMSTETVTQPATADAVAAPVVQTVTLETVQAEHTAALAALTAAHTTALAEKDKKIAELAVAVVEKDAIIAAGDDELVGALDEIEQLETKLAEASQFDARKLGVAPVKVRAAQLEAVAKTLTTPEEKLAHYDKLTSAEEKKAFRDAHWADLSAALSARS